MLSWLDNWLDIDWDALGLGDIDWDAVFFRMLLTLTIVLVIVIVGSMIFVFFTETEKFKKRVYAALVKNNAPASVINDVRKLSDREKILERVEVWLPAKDFLALTEPEPPKPEPEPKPDLMVVREQF